MTHQAHRIGIHQAAYNILAVLAIFLFRKRALHIIANISLSNVYRDKNKTKTKMLLVV